MRAALHAIVILVVTLAITTPARAQTIVTPLVSANIKTTPGIFDLDDAATQTHFGVGVAVSRVTDGWLGVEGEVMFTPSAFSGGDLIDSSRFVTATAKVLALAPTRVGLRSYVSFGIGVAQISSEDVVGLFTVNATRLVASLGGGAWKWLTPRIGIRAGIDFVRTVHEVETEPFETWRPSGGVSIKF